MPRLTPASSYILAANTREREKQERLSYQEFLGFYNSPYRLRKFHCFERLLLPRLFQQPIQTRAALDVAQTERLKRGDRLQDPHLPLSNSLSRIFVRLVAAFVPRPHVAYLCWTPIRKLRVRASPNIPLTSCTGAGELIFCWLAFWDA